MQRQEVTNLVEDYWRTLIPAMQNFGMQGFQETSSRFEQLVSQTAAQLSPIEAAAFTQQVDAERERLMAEYQANPVALKQRLCVPLGADAPVARSRQSNNDLGGLVVRTAVRATVWESIWALFRAFR